MVKDAELNADEDKKKVEMVQPQALRDLVTASINSFG